VLACPRVFACAQPVAVAVEADSLAFQLYSGAVQCAAEQQAGHSRGGARRGEGGGAYIKRVPVQHLVLEPLLLARSCPSFKPTRAFQADCCTRGINAPAA